jgi:hypothetical protein
VSEWGRRTFGDPCRECGFSWALDRDEAVARLAGVPPRYREALAGSDGRARLPELAWSAGAYVCHVADNLRIWAERLAGAALGSTRPVALYDEDRLAAARSYGDVAVEGALWSLERAVDEWLVAAEMATETGAALTHAERGEIGLDDVVLTNLHDAVHHEWDIRRTVAAEGSAT